MRGDGPDGVGRDVEGEVDRALRRPGAVHSAAAQNGPRTVSPLEIRAALWDAISAGRGIVVLEVTRRGEPAVRARLSPIVWAALWDSLAPSPMVEDEEEEEEAAR